MLVQRRNEATGLGLIFYLSTLPHSRRLIKN